MPLNNYLFKFQQTSEPACECETGIETVDHFLFICPRFAEQRKTLITNLKKLRIQTTTAALSNPKAFGAIAEYCSSSWRLKDRWEWARITEEPLPTNLRPPMA